MDFSIFHPFSALFHPSLHTSVRGSAPLLGAGRHPQGEGSREAMQWILSIDSSANRHRLAAGQPTTVGSQPTFSTPQPPNALATPFSPARLLPQSPRTFRCQRTEILHPLGTGAGRTLHKVRVCNALRSSPMRQPRRAHCSSAHPLGTPHRMGWMLMSSGWTRRGGGEGGPHRTALRASSLRGLGRIPKRHHRAEASCARHSPCFSPGQ